MKTRHFLMILPIAGLAIFATACTYNSTNTNYNTNTYTPILNTNMAAANTNTDVNSNTNAATNLNANQNTNAAMNTNSATVNTNTAVLTQAVSIAGMAFTPQDLMVKVGTKITWTNNDGVTHTVTGDNGGPSSGNVAPGTTYTYTFSTVGTFPYHCSIHPSMTGTITVTN